MDTEQPIIRHVFHKDFQINYHPNESQFELIIAAPAPSENIPLPELRLWLPDDIVRQMAELLPPLDSDVVH